MGKAGEELVRRPPAGAALHKAVRWLQRLRKGIWFLARPHTSGAHAVALTPEGRIVLVTLSYEDGWRLPGGGRRKGEPAEQAALRELREEIGMTCHGTVEKVAEFRHRIDFKTGDAALFVVRDVEYAPRWTLEVAEVGAFPPEALPDDLAPIARRMIEAALPQA
jgi:8-oxo-dGTP pyrophosphatase MutT (NUDIX family)